MNVDEEEKMFQLLKNKNQEALNWLYDKFAPAIYGTICKEVTDKESATEILKSVFIHFIENIKTRRCVEEGFLICLLRISRKIMVELNKVVKTEEGSKDLFYTPQSFSSSLVSSPI